MVLIGSKAIKYHFNDFKREPKDIDYIVKTSEKYDRVENTEYLINPIFDDYKYSIMQPDDLYTLKISHVVGWNINWDKHMFDIQFLKSKGCKINIELFYKLYNYWNSVHEKNNRSKLDMSTEDFFDNAIRFDYNHDDLHTLLKPIPTYIKVLEDNHEVLVSENKFEQLRFEEKCDLVYEEVCVMALERYYNTLDYMFAYSKMLKKFIISHAPLWEAIFIIENYIKLHKPPYNYYKKITDNLHLITPKNN